MSVTTLRNIYQLKITLIGAKPPIWRRILVPSDMALDQLHIVLQISMGWANCHLHQFICGRSFYGIPDEDFGMDLDLKNEADYRLHHLLKSEKDSFIYEYDFGDGWEHKIVLEKILPFNKELKLPLCNKGKRACPPEDCGGIWGYQDLLATLNDPKHSEYESMLEWLGGNFDFEAFDSDGVNALFAEYIR